MSNEMIIRELKSVASDHGGILRAEDVVEFASNPETALHSRFTWEDTEAARLWRLHEARNIIRVTVEMMPQAERNFKVFVSLTPDRQADGGGYRPLVSVMGSEEMRTQLLADAISEMRIFRRKYETLRELSRVFEEMDRVIRPKARGKTKRKGGRESVARA